MSLYPAKAPLIDVLAETARRAALESNSEHPEDIACEMVNAIEHAAVALQIAHQQRA